MEFLKATIKQNLPFFNNLELTNRTLKLQLTQRQTTSKNIDKLSQKVKTLERKLANTQEEKGK